MGPETPTPHFPPLESGVGTGGEMGVHALQAPEAGWTRWRPSHRSFLCSGPSAEPCGVPPPATLGRHRQAPNSTTDDSERQTDRQTDRKGMGDGAEEWEVVMFVGGFLLDP